MPSPVAEYFVPPSRWGAESDEAVAASGSTVTFADGSSAICAISGLWNASLGYGNPAIADAIHRANLEASALPLFRRGSRYARDAAAALLRFAEPHSYDYVFFSTSGSAALDSCVKLVRQCHALNGAPRRKRILSFSGSYHGMTVGAMAVTGEYLLQDVYGVDERLHLKVPHDDLGALDAVLSRYGSDIAAVIIEPLLGSGALLVPGEVVDFLIRGREEHGYALVADEVATGFYRTGPRFASHDWPAQPDILITSKALTNGTSAASALLVGGIVAEAFVREDAVFWHGETQGASPQTGAAIVATIQEYERRDIARAAAALASKVDEGLGRLVARSDSLSVSGRGCFRGLHVTRPDGTALDAVSVAELVRRLRWRGVLVQPGPGSVELVPNFLTSDQELARIFEALSHELAA